MCIRDRLDILDEPTIGLHARDNEQLLAALEQLKARGNSVLGEYLENILARTFAYMVFVQSFLASDRNPSVGEHQAIVEALRARDPDRAEGLIRHHLSRTVGDFRA